MIIEVSKSQFEEWSKKGGILITDCFDPGQCHENETSFIIVYRGWVYTVWGIAEIQKQKLGEIEFDVVKISYGELDSDTIGKVPWLYNWLGVL
jgi:hypothetical protein